ncbi:hypothetical protein [Sinorhizobium meliloti]|uniref:hypothetical protein n=1 Tax=Rhizobium meliloti TaxID=382 RepID=UPI000FDA160B|nr:hypothetical protein [Sinorhizobium meliloti]RVL26632.1 hypothetical protein CN144_23325 [Sinorhizobium meliloti]
MIDDFAFQAQCLSEVGRDTSNNFDPDELISVVKRHLRPVDADTIQEQRAKRIIEKWQRDGSTPNVGQIWLPGFDPISHEPLKLIASIDGKRMVEKDRASLEFLEAGQERRIENLKRVEQRVRIGQAEIDEMRRWQREQLALGRPVLDLTWGNCIREAGLLHEKKGRAA